MQKAFAILTVTATLVLAGCAGPEQKLGRGLRNITEFARGGEIMRSVEQTALWESPNKGYTTGFIRGFNRSMARTFIGAYEVATFPFPGYDPLLTPKTPLYPDYNVRTTKEPYGGLVLPEDPVYPASYKPGLVSGSIFATDAFLGFSSGDVFPFSPGSRFRIYDH